MSEILGYDIDGRPLRAGDRVKLVGDDIKPQFVGDEHTIVGPLEAVIRIPWEELLGDNEPRVRLDDGGFTTCASCRRLDDRTDHQPSQESFEALMNRLKSGDIVQRPEGVVA